MILPARIAAVDLAPEIARLKRELNAVILAHYYQEGEIQDVADVIGDSLQLAREAARSQADVIVFCGVHFMAETAKILSPQKLVLLPDLAAGCSLSESAPADAFKRFVDAHPGHVVVTYVNSSAAVKALSDYCCTSSNAVAVVNSIPRETPIIFAPDRFLGDYVARKTGRELVLWQGSCEVHELFSGGEISRLKQEHPGSITLVHPECPAAVRALGDVVGSTKALLDAVRTGPEDGTFIVVTEPGIIHQMQKVRPRAIFIPAPAEIRGSEQGSCTSCNTCPHMRRNTLLKLYQCMDARAPEIRLPADIIARARLPIERMLALG
ncbi:MAG: quinolinate synthase NadA [Planctomycetes bacterium]|nr:quinolinate synthase NadA [Planctomycetota bacterium]